MLVNNTNLHRISHHFRDIEVYWSHFRLWQRNRILSETRIQWSSGSNGLMCSDLHDKKIGWAAAFSTDSICPKGALRRRTGQDRVAVINLAAHQCTSQGQQGLMRQGTPHATDLSQCRKAWTDGCDDVRPHGKVAVSMDAEVGDRRDWWNYGAADANRPDWDLILTALGRAPHDFCLAGVKLQLVGPHPWWHVVNATGNSALQTDGLERAT